MAAPTSLAATLSRGTGGNNGNPRTYYVFRPKTTSTGGSYGVLSNLYWSNYGVPAEMGASPQTQLVGYQLDRTSTGSLFQANASGGRSLYLTSVKSTMVYVGDTYDVSHGLFVFDKLAHVSFSYGNSPGNVTGTMAAGRYTNGEGNELWAVNGQAFDVQSTLTVTYTNQAGTGSRTTVGFELSSGVATDCYRIQLQSGDTGIRSIQSLSWTASGSFGAWTLVLLHPYAHIPYARLGATKNLLVNPGGPPQVMDDACVCIFHGRTQSSTCYGYELKMLEA